MHKGGAIERHLPPKQFEVLKAAEESERDIITRLVGKSNKRGCDRVAGKEEGRGRACRLYREREIARACAARRDPKKRAANGGGSKGETGRCPGRWLDAPLMIEKP